MITARINNRSAAVALPAFTIPDDRMFHIARKGEFPGTMELDGKEINVIQVVDDQAIAEMYNRFQADKAKPEFVDLLVDRDHLSNDPKNETIAEGWIQNVEQRGGNDLYAEIRLSEQGAKDLTGGNYRFISSVWNVKPIGGGKFAEGCRVRPYQLCEAGFTNRPQITALTPLSNREKTLPDNPVNAPASQADIQNRNKKTMKQIATKLGLSADASEDAILGTVTKLMNRADSAEAEAKPLKEENATLKNRLIKIEEDSADAELDAAGIAKDDSDRPEIKKALIANRDGGRALLKKIAKPAAATPSRITNRDTAKTPGSKKEGEANDEPSADDIKLAARISNRASEIERVQKVPFSRAHAMAVDELTGGKA